LQTTLINSVLAASKLIVTYIL